MQERDVIRSQPFNAPFVRVRGRVSRQGVVMWSPCLRTFHPPRWVTAPHGDKPPRSVTGGIAASVVRGQEHGYMVVFEDERGKVLARAPVHIRFFAHERQWALFTERLAYYRDTHRVVLLLDGRELGALVVPKHLPEFVLTRPVTPKEVDVHGVLHVRWKLTESEEAEAKKAPLTYYVRYSADHRQWYRPGVNLTKTAFDLDLREMPGGEHCVAQVIATNGYETSYVETPPFAVPRKAPQVLMATPSGPLLFAQGFSREEGPLVGKSIEWMADGKRSVGTGASFDARHLGRGVHKLDVRVTDSRGRVTTEHVGSFNGVTGLRTTAHPGY